MKLKTCIAILVTLLAVSKGTQSLECNSEFLNSIGLDGLEKPQMMGMIMCKEVQVKCCTLMDELKFHKHWNSYYKLKAARIFEVLEDVYSQIHDPIEYFHKMAGDYGVAPPAEEEPKKEDAKEGEKKEEEKPKGRLLTEEKPEEKSEEKTEDAGKEEDAAEGDTKKKDEKEEKAPNEFIGIALKEHWERLGGALHMISQVEKPKAMKLGIEIKGFEKDIIKKKETFLCLACDITTHLGLSEIDKSITVNESICADAIEGYSSTLKKKLLKVDKILAMVDDIMDMFSDKNENLKKDKTVNHRIKRIAKAGEKCLANNAYNFQNCEELCSYHSLIDISPAFFGDLNFYRSVVTRFKVFEKFIAEAFENLENAAKEAEKKKEEKKPKGKARILSTAHKFLFKKLSMINKSVRNYKKQMSKIKKKNKRMISRIMKVNRKLSHSLKSKLKREKKKNKQMSRLHQKLLEDSNKNYGRKYSSRRRRRVRSYAWNQPINRYNRYNRRLDDPQPQQTVVDSNQAAPPVQQQAQLPPPQQPAQQPVQQQEKAKEEEEEEEEEEEPVPMKNKEGEVFLNYNGKPILVNEKGEIQSQDPKGNAIAKDKEGNPIIILEDGTVLPDGHVVWTDGKVYKKGDEPPTPEMMKAMMKAQREIYGMMYDSAKKGSEEKLKSDDDINNALFESAGKFNFLEFKLSFKSWGLDNKYEISRLLEDTKDAMIEEMLEKENEEPKSYNMTVTNETDSNVVRIVSAWTEDEVFDFNYDLSLIVGGIPVEEDEEELRVIQDTIERFITLQEKIDSVQFFLKDFKCEEEKKGPPVVPGTEAQTAEKTEGAEGEEKPEGEEPAAEGEEAAEAPAEAEGEGPEERILSSLRHRRNRTRYRRWLEEEEEAEAPAEEEPAEGEPEAEGEAEGEGEEKAEGEEKDGKEAKSEAAAGLEAVPEEEPLTPKECKESKKALEDGLKKWIERLKQYKEFLSSKGLPLPKKEDEEKPKEGEAKESAEGEEGGEAEKDGEEKVEEEKSDGGEEEAPSE